MQRNGILLGTLLALTFTGHAPSAFAQSGEIKIGEINSYSLLPAFTEPYRKGWQLAVEEINAAGGVNGKKLVVISKDDGGKPADAQRFRQSEKSILPRRRASDRRYHLVQGQSLHFPAASFELHAGGDAGG